MTQHVFGGISVVFADLPRGTPTPTGVRYTFALKSDPAAPHFGVTVPIPAAPGPVDPATVDVPSAGLHTWVVEVVDNASPPNVIGPVLSGEIDLPADTVQVLVASGTLALVS